jgi:hypothetical protein
MAFDTTIDQNRANPGFEEVDRFSRERAVYCIFRFRFVARSARPRPTRHHDQSGERNPAGRPEYNPTRASILAEVPQETKANHIVMIPLMTGPAGGSNSVREAEQEGFEVA